MATSSDNKQGSKSGSKQSDTSKRGFASMDPAQQREIASEGGRAAHEKGTAHEFTSEEARRAGSQSHKNDGNRQSASTSPGTREHATMRPDNSNDTSGGASKQSGGAGSSVQSGGGSSSGSGSGSRGGS
ncbi:KGG domain-containing protein [Janthinobacterium sp. Mn2066]|uniref:KGG domain-containing protein n=1 Tax=Janthinobacterium sp. Mn2066 TaxID=3395264 RepID=UPI003BDA6A29